MPVTPDLRVIDLLSGVVGFLREAGLLGLLLLFGWALFTDKLHFHKDFVRAEQRGITAQEELEAERVRSSTLALTVDRLSLVLEKATGGLERSVAHRIAVEEGLDVADVLAELGSKKVGAHTRLVYPDAAPVRPITRKRRLDSKPGAEN